MAYVQGSRCDGAESTRELAVRAQVTIEPHPESNCVVLSATEDTDDVSQQLKTTGGTDAVDHSPQERRYDECHTELVPDEGQSDRAYLTSSVHAKCICPVLTKHDCIADVKGVRSGALIVSLTVPRRAVLRELLLDLQAIDARVSVEWIVPGNQSEATAELDVSSITEKQREAVEMAIEMGYYETPRETDLASLADCLGISKSAVSQRLNAAEAKLVKAFTSP